MSRGDVRIDGKKLRSIRDGRVLTQEDFAREMGVSRAWLNMVEARGAKKVLRSKVVQIAKSLRMEASELIAREGTEDVFDDRSIEPYSEVGMHGEPPTFDLSVAAGPWADVAGVEQVYDPVQIERGLFRVRISGDSMKPAYLSGEIVEFRVLRDGVDKLVEGRDYYVQREERRANFKRLHRYDDEAMELEAVNKRVLRGAMRVGRDDVVRMAEAVAVVRLVGGR